MHHAPCIFIVVRMHTGPRILRVVIPVPHLQLLFMFQFSLYNASTVFKASLSGYVRFSHTQGARRHDVLSTRSAVDHLPLIEI
jgi:hypothetical protein